MHKNLQRLFDNLDVDVVYNASSNMYVDPDHVVAAPDVKSTGNKYQHHWSNDPYQMQ